MAQYIDPIEQLIEQFHSLPGIGKKSAMRMAFGVLDWDRERIEKFTDTIASCHNRVHSCLICGNYCEGDLCPVCSDDRRDKTTVCVVEDAKALLSMERVESYRGVYHVLGGTISPIDGRGPDDIRIPQLIERVRVQGVKEVIVATNATLDGETTAMYISRLLKPYGVKTTRLAYGIPVGGDLDYADEMTLFRAMDGRKEIE